MRIAERMSIMSILYIDDDIEDIEIFRDALIEVNPSIELLTARNGKDALALLGAADQLPKYIVLDINMPGMDGKSCLQEIRKERRFDPISVVIYSTNGFPQDIEQIEALGARFVRKANSFDDLRVMIRGMVDQTQTG